MTPITVSHELGENTISKYILNLTSASDDYITSRFASVFNMSRKPSVMPIILRNNYDIVNMTFRKPTNQLMVDFIVDEDDTTADIKIRNICAMNRFLPRTKGVYSLCESTSNDLNRKGLEIRVGSRQMSERLKLLLGVGALSASKDVSSYVIVKINNQIEGSIAALTQQINDLGIPFMVEEHNSIPKPSWLLMPINTMKSIILDADKIKSHKQDEIKEKNDWSRRTGCSCYIETSIGLADLETDMITKKQLEQKGKSQETKRTIDILLEGLLQVLTNIIDWVSKYLLIMFNYASNMGKKEVDKTKRKRKPKTKKNG